LTDFLGGGQNMKKAKLGVQKYKKRHYFSKSGEEANAPHAPTQM